MPDLPMLFNVNAMVNDLLTMASLAYALAGGAVAWAVWMAGR